MISDATIKILYSSLQAKHIKNLGRKYINAKYGKQTKEQENQKSHAEPQILVPEKGKLLRD